jgi:hypothetical protein
MWSNHEMQQLFTNERGREFSLINLMLLSLIKNFKQLILLDEAICGKFINAS